MGEMFDDVLQSIKTLKPTHSPRQQLITQYIINTPNTKVFKWQNKLYTTWATFYETPAKCTVHTDYQLS
jgi:hypothetical protein